MINILEIMKDDLCNSSLLLFYTNIIMLIILGAILGLSLNMFLIDKNDTYKNGQIDAINGVIKYELKQQPNGEQTWGEKE